MSEISVIAGVSPGAIRLLEAAGVRRIDNLARQDVTKLFRRLEAINAQRSWMGSELTAETVGQWIHNARTVVSGPLRQGQALAISTRDAGDLNINLEQVPEVIILDDLKNRSAQAPAPAPEEAPAAGAGGSVGGHRNRRAHPGKTDGNRLARSESSSTVGEGMEGGREGAVSRLFRLRPK